GQVTLAVLVWAGELLQLLACADVPDLDAWGGADQRLPIGGEGQLRHTVLLTFPPQSPQPFPRREIPKIDRPVLAPGGEQLAPLGQREGNHAALLAPECGDEGARRDLPDLDGLVQVV